MPRVLAALRAADGAVHGTGARRAAPALEALGRTVLGNLAFVLPRGAAVRIGDALAARVDRPLLSEARAAAATLAAFLHAPVPHVGERVARPLQTQLCAAVAACVRRPAPAGALLVAALRLSALVQACPGTLPDYVPPAVNAALVLMRVAHDETTRTILRKALANFWDGHKLWWHTEYAAHFSEEDADELRFMCGNNHYFA